MYLLTRFRYALRTTGYKLVQPPEPRKYERNRTHHPPPTLPPPQSYLSRVQVGVSTEEAIEFVDPMVKDGKSHFG